MEAAAGVLGKPEFVFRKFCSAIGGELSGDECIVENVVIRRDDDKIEVWAAGRKVSSRIAAEVGKGRWKLKCGSSKDAKLCTLGVEDSPPSVSILKFEHVVTINVSKPLSGSIDVLL